MATDWLLGSEEAQPQQNRGGSGDTEGNTSERAAVDTDSRAHLAGASEG